MSTSAAARIARRSGWSDALLAGATTLSVSLPLTTVLQDSRWLGTAAVVVVVVAVCGIVLRAVRATPVLVVLTQAVLWVVTMLWLFLRETLWWGLPTSETATAAGALFREAGDVLQTYAAPAPVPDGVAFLVVALVGLTALSVDSISVTGAAPAIAGLPLAAAFMVPVSNSGTALDLRYFALSAALWLAMVVAQHTRVIASWSSLRLRVGAVTWAQRAWAAGLAGTAVAVALIAALTVPHLPPTFLADGLGRSEGARDLGGGTGSVAFAETMNLDQDLRDQSTAPVLEYRTDARDPAPLRVTATSVYSGGEWQAPQYRDELQGSGQFSVPETAATAPPSGTEVETARITVTRNGMQAPFLALPDSVVTAELGVPWSYDQGTEAIRVDRAPNRYDGSFLVSDVVDIDVAELPQDGPTASDVSAEYLRLDPGSADRVTALAAELTADANSQLGAANLIQAHLRSQEYTYSLTLAPGVESADPIVHFLDTQQGYCVQFATAMVMMARAEGIPARMAVGFLPGDERADGTHVVRANDAHSWPELYLDGIGWTRFEPTPGVRSGTPPSYSVGNPDPDAPETTTPPAEEDQNPPPEQDPFNPEEQLEGQEQTSTTPQETSGFSGLTVVLIVIALVLVLLAVLWRALCWGAARYRGAPLRAASTPAQQAEGAWLMLNRSLLDLGIPPPPPRSPREMYDSYRSRTALGPESQDALRRIADALERARYADPGPAEAAPVSVGGPGTSGPALQARVATSPHSATAEAMRADVRRIAADARSRTSATTRWKSRLLPRSGWHWLRSLIRRRAAGPQHRGTDGADQAH